jgi:glyoxylase-like metal-dependent hydrolase (beta-lactamase superfamily II)
MHIGSNVFRVKDTCNVYLIREGREGILVDFGRGDVLDRLPELGVERVTDVLMTHHHRDQAQGLARAAAAGIRIWVPPTERDLFDKVDEHWQARTIDNSYDVREDRFSLLEPVPIAGTVPLYKTRRFGQVAVTTMPTPGHTPGSVSYLVERDGRRLAFTGDLLAAPGKVPSLAATQWTYTGIEGLGATILSGLDLIDRRPDVLLPSHGDPIDEPEAAIELTNRRLRELIVHHGSPEWDVEALRAHPYIAISGHLHRNRTSVSTSYALLSDDGAALLLDFGYDFTTGLPQATDRSSRVPWLETIPALKAQHGIDRIEVAIPTHYHDDHIAGFNLLREVEGTEIWAGVNVAPILTDPLRYDLPCLWYEPIPVDRAIAFERPLRWHEYEITIHDLPGHTPFANAIEFEVDGLRVIATGDQQDGRWSPAERGEYLNYQYRNRFRFDDFERSAELYRRLRPDLLISGHWLPRRIDDAYLDELLRVGREFARLHRQLLPLDEVDFGAEGFGVRIEPYRTVVKAGTAVRLTAFIVNPFRRPAEANVSAVTPSGWAVEPRECRLPLAASSRGQASFIVRSPAGSAVRRGRVAVDLTVDGVPFGQQAEALVTVV